MKGTFEGFYYKQQSADATVAVIAGRTDTEAFVQVLSGSGSYHVEYGLEEYRRLGPAALRIGPNSFSTGGITLNIQDERLRVSGSIAFLGITPLVGDIMGPFRRLPMECRHTIVSMRHSLAGTLHLNGRSICFDGGRGYIEGDSGRSFPERYMWFHCNDFAEHCSVMAAMALVSVMGVRFNGCIAVVRLREKQYRLATYLGARTMQHGERSISIRQGKLCLQISLKQQEGHPLKAPALGQMRRIVRQTPECGARVRLWDGEDILFDGISSRASFERG